MKQRDIKDGRDLKYTSCSVATAYEYLPQGSFPLDERGLSCYRSAFIYCGVRGCVLAAAAEQLQIPPLLFW